MPRLPANPLVAALATGRPEAYAALFDRLHVPMLRVGRTLLGSAADAEDAVQDVFVELVRQRERLPRGVDLDAYVFAMLRHAAIRRIRQRQTERRHVVHGTASAAAPAN